MSLPCPLAYSSKSRQELTTPKSLTLSIQSSRIKFTMTTPCQQAGYPFFNQSFNEINKFVIFYDQSQYEARKILLLNFSYLMAKSNMNG